MTVTKRNSNIEVLRIIAMCGVIFLHMNAGIWGLQDIVHRGSANSIVLIIINAISIISVDLFMMISGYCSGGKRSVRLSKIIDLLAMVIVFQLIGLFVRVIFGIQTLSFFNIVKQIIPANYFVILYCVTYLLSPYTNRLICSLNEKSAKNLVMLIFIAFCVLPMIPDGIINLSNSNLNALSTISLYGSGQGYSIVNFVSCYIFGAVLFAFPGIFNIPRKTAIILFWILYAFELVWMIVVRLKEVDPSISHAYYNPLIIAMSFLILEIAVDKEEKNNSFINNIAKAAFITYLFHGTLLVLVEHYFSFEKVLEGNMIFFFLFLIGSIILIYAICIPISWLYNATIGFVLKTKLLSRISIEIIS